MGGSLKSLLQFDCLSIHTRLWSFMRYAEQRLSFSQANNKNNLPYRHHVRNYMLRWTTRKKWTNPFFWRCCYFWSPRHALAYPGVQFTISRIWEETAQEDFADQFPEAHVYLYMYISRNLGTFVTFVDTRNYLVNSITGQRTNDTVFGLIAAHATCQCTLVCIGPCLPPTVSVSLRVDFFSILADEGAKKAFDICFSRMCSLRNF